MSPLTNFQGIWGFYEVLSVVTKQMESQDVRFAHISQNNAIFLGSIAEINNS
jgi:hypothetical protein